MTWSQFVQNVVTTFSQDYGVTKFFSSPQAAFNWVESNIIGPNPRLTDYEKGILRFWSRETLDYANLQVATTSISSRDGAYLYWDLMQDYVNYHTFDEQLYNVFEVAASSAEDTANPETGVTASNLKIPWWIIAIPIALLFFRRK